MIVLTALFGVFVRSFVLLFFFCFILLAFTWFIPAFLVFDASRRLLCDAYILPVIRSLV